MQLVIFINFVSYDKFLFNQMIVLGNKRQKKVINKSKLNNTIEFNYQTTKY
jgi:hypothetical protein